MHFKTVFLILGLFVFAGLMITSCDDDDDAKPVEKTVLADSIEVAGALLVDTEEGINDGQYSSDARTQLQKAIVAAQAVMGSTTVTQAQVGNAVVALSTAIETYRDAEIAPIAEADLVGHWSFDEGTGTIANDESANNFDGAFKKGPELWGAGFPTWVLDRNGDAGKAIHVDEGGNIEVPYNTNLNPKQLTIALWVNADEIDANNRFMGLQSWIGYKFQLQEANRPFASVSHAAGTYDRDAEVNLPINEWHHVAFTFGGGNMIFYIDGVAVKTWDNTPGDAKSISGTPYNLVFGQDFPTDQYAATDANFETDQKIPLAWGGYFRGMLDEVRIYKTVLTATQVESIFNREKP